MNRILTAGLLAAGAAALPGLALAAGPSWAGRTMRYRPAGSAR
ncbi:hypothetical protein [Mangrovicoccus ximenensis]|nr:hypothetical protein [Mangrovicoccus ximenensis]